MPPMSRSEPATRPAGPDRLEEASAVARRLLENIERVVHGKRDEVALVLAALVAGGHVLLEDVPGTAKTVLARAIAGSVRGATVARIQCTPDLQPSDAIGLSVYDARSRDFEFRPGPVFANLVLVDEINRAMPKTQSALLEAMAEHQVTVDGEARALPRPFLLLATENPIEQEGTFPLPEAQLDRFFLKAGLGYPGADDEVRIVREQRRGHPLASLRPVVALEEVLELQEAVAEVYVDDLVQRWIVDLVRATREVDGVMVGASVRGTLALERVARAWALLGDRPYVAPDDVDRLFLPVIAHRVVFAPSFLAETRLLPAGEALERFRAACLALAPAPEVEPWSGPRA
jgi:MoxR-like ATPase